MDLSGKRVEYDNQSIDVETVDRCPFKQFENWFQQATESKLIEPNADDAGNS